MNVLLIGMPGAGKTTVGKMLARRLSSKFIDLDRLIEEKAGISIPEIFADHGEKGFRRVEKAVIQEMLETTNSVIATGGGSVVDSKNWTVFKRLGPIFALVASTKVLEQRLVGFSGRPLLDIAGVKNRKKVLDRLLAGRQKYYDRADYVIETEDRTAEAVVEAILEVLRN